MIKVAFTKFDPLGDYVGKRFRHNEEGAVEKISAAQLSTGTFETVECEWSDFGKAIQELKTGQPICFGVCNRNTASGPLKKGRLISSKKETELKSRGQDLLDMASRTKNNFKWHEPPCPNSNILFIDVDDLSDETVRQNLGLGQEVINLEPEEALKEVLLSLLDIYPFLATLEGGCWASASASAYIYDKKHNRWHSRLKGAHFYFVLPNYIKIEDCLNGNAKNHIKDFFIAKTWLAGKAYYEKQLRSTTNNGQCYVKSPVKGPIDFTVWQNQRLDFVSGAQCEGDLEQRLPDPIWFDTYDLEVQDQLQSSEARFEISEEDLVNASVLMEQAKIAISAEIDAENERVYTALCVRAETGQLLPHETTPEQFKQLMLNEIPSDLEWVLDSGQRIRVWELIIYPELHKGKTGHDPFQPEKGKCKCKFYYNPGSDLGFQYVLHTFSRGEENIMLKLDLGGIRHMISQNSEASKKTALKIHLESNSRWYEELARMRETNDYETILELLESADLGKPSEINAMVNRNAKTSETAKKLTMLEKVNERFAFVSINGTARFIEFGGSVGNSPNTQNWKAHNEQSFKLSLKNWGFVQTFNPATGKYGAEEVSSAWLKWDGRREFSGVRFDPNQDVEFEDDHGGLVLNYFRGFAVNPADDQTRSCKKKHCSNRGCLHYFFDEVSIGNSGICPAGWGAWKKDWDSLGRFSDNKDISDRAGADSNLTYWCRTIYDSFCDGNLDHTRWVVDWFVDILQAPGGRGKKGRAGTCIAIRGAHGTGKNMVINMVGDVLGKYFLEIAGKSDLGHNFNAAKEYCLLMHGVEAFNYSTHGEAEVLKSVITDDKIRIEPKNIDAYFATNYIRVILSSNADSVVRAANTERRFTVFDAVSIRRENRRWFERVKECSPSVFLAEALAWKIKSNIQAYLETKGLERQKIMSRTLTEDALIIMAQKGLLWDDNGAPESFTGADLYEALKVDIPDLKVTPRKLIQNVLMLLKDCGVSVQRNKIQAGGERTWSYRAGFKDEMLERVLILKSNLEEIEGSVEEEIEGD